MIESRFEFRAEDEDNVHEIDVGEWQEVEAPFVAETTGLGPCLGISIQKEQDTVAVVGHFFDPRMDQFDDMIEACNQKFPIKEGVIVHLAGAAPSSPDQEGIEDAKEVREYVRVALHNSGYSPENIHTSFTSTTHETAVLYVDPGTKEVKVDIKEDLPGEDI